MNLSDAIDFTFLNRRAWRSGNGAPTARINSNHCIRILGADLSVYYIETKHFAQLSRQLEQEGKSAATINRVCAALSTVLKELQMNGYKLDPPKFKRQVESKGRVTFFTDQEVDLMLKAAANLNDYLLLHDSILFSLKTGCRQSELLKLRRQDIDFERMEVTFRDVKTSESTGVRDHVLPLNKELVPILERRLTYGIDAAVFPWSCKDQLLRAFKRVRDQCGIDPSKIWHTIRHTTATVLCEKGVPLRTVMGVLNHSNVATTLRYAKASDKALMSAIDLL